MKATIRQWGNSASIRIPAHLMRALRLRVDQAVEVREESGRLVIEPLRRPVFDLDDLLKRITAGNRHAPADFGPPRGREVW